jgi:hypothetical protein
MAEQTKTSKKSALSSSVTNDDKIKAVKFFWDGYRNGFSYIINKYLYTGKNLKNPAFNEGELDKFEHLKEQVEDELERMTHTTKEIRLKTIDDALKIYIQGLESSFQMNLNWRVFSTENTKLFRGINELPTDINKVLGVNKSFLSTSPLIDVAVTHAHELNLKEGKPAFIIEYDIEPGIPMIDMDKLGHDIMMVWQQEFVLPPGLTSTLIAEGTYTVPPVEKTKTLKTKKKVGKKTEYEYTEEKYTEPGYTLPLFKVRISKTVATATGGRKHTKNRKIN